MELKDRFFYRNWWLFYLLFFLLLGLLLYALFWKPICNDNSAEINKLKSQNAQLSKDLNDCRNQKQPPVDSTAVSQVVNCDAQVNSGGEGNTETKHTLGSQSGKVIVDYDAKSIPDKIDVIYDGKVVATTGDLASGIGQLEWDYVAASGKPDFCIVIVSAPQTNTAWAYRVNCPQ